MNDSTQEIKVKDVVVLKSGGPEMTVVSVKDGYAECQYFDKKDLKSVNIMLGALAKPPNPLEFYKAINNAQRRHRD